MCSPVALGAISAGSSVMGGAVGLHSAYQQAGQYRTQAGIYGNQAAVYGLQANAFEGQANFARAMGGYQAALDTTRASQAQLQGEINQGEAAKQAQQVVGAGKTAFAANGILLEGRAGSAPAMWEQDEAAALAWEQSIIKTNADNEVFGYLANANMARAQGRMQAAGYLSQADAARINAQSALLQAGMARSAGRAAIITGYAGLLGSAGQGAGSYGSIAGFGSGGGGSTSLFDGPSYTG